MAKPDPGARSLSQMSPENVVRFGSLLCRALPASLAYRWQFRFFDHLTGMPIPFEARSRFGRFAVRGSLRNPDDAAFALHGLTNLVGVVVARLTSPSYILELGANVGTDTLCYAALTGCRGKVVAVEASAENCAELQQRVQRNAIENVLIIDRAVSDRPGKLQVFFDSDRPGQSFTKLQSPLERTRSNLVSAITVDEITSSYGPPSLVIADLEGFEARAFRGAHFTLETARPLIVTEVDSGLLQRSGCTLGEFAQLLECHSYALFDLQSRDLEPVTRRNCDADTHVHTDWLAIPHERVGLETKVRRGLYRARYLPPFGPLSPLGGRPRRSS